MSVENVSGAPVGSGPPWVLIGLGVLLSVGGLVAVCVWLMMLSKPASTGAALTVRHVPNAALGVKLYMQSCASCHGPKGHGMPHQGAGLRQSKFVATKGDAEIVEVIRDGRLASSSDTVLNLAMPAKGNNPNLSESDMLDLVAHLRNLQKEASP